MTTCTCATHLAYRHVLLLMILLRGRWGRWWRQRQAWDSVAFSAASHPSLTQPAAPHLHHPLLIITRYTDHQRPRCILHFRGGGTRISRTSAASPLPLSPILQETRGTSNGPAFRPPIAEMGKNRLHHSLISGEAFLIPFSLHRNVDCSSSPAARIIILFSGPDYTGRRNDLVVFVRNFHSTPSH